MILALLAKFGVPFDWISALLAEFGGPLDSNPALLADFGKLLDSISALLAEFGVPLDLISACVGRQLALFILLVFVGLPCIYSYHGPFDILPMHALPPFLAQTLPRPNETSTHHTLICQNPFFQFSPLPTPNLLQQSVAWFPYQISTPADLQLSSSR